MVFRKPYFLCYETNIVLEEIYISYLDKKLGTMRIFIMCWILSKLYFYKIEIYLFCQHFPQQLHFSEKEKTWQQIQKSALRTQAASGSRAKGCRARDRRPSANFLARNSRWESSPPTQCLFAGWERMTLFWLLSTAGLPRVLLGKDQKESGRAKRWKTTAGNKKKRGGWLSKMSERRRKRKRGRKRRFWWWWWCWGYNRWF